MFAAGVKLNEFEVQKLRLFSPWYLQRISYNITDWELMILNSTLREGIARAFAKMGQ